VALDVPVIELMAVVGAIPPNTRASSVEAEADFRLYLQRQGLEEAGIALIRRIMDLLMLAPDEPHA
jgi:hypothetical protein